MNRSEKYGDRRVIAVLDNFVVDNHPRYSSMRALREATAEHEGYHAFRPSGMKEADLVASLRKINAILEAEGLKPVSLDVEGRPSYWILAAPWQPGLWEPA